LGVDALIAAVPALEGMTLEAEQVAQIDSKNMSFRDLAAPGLARGRTLERDEVGGIVITARHRHARRNGVLPAARAGAGQARGC